MISRTNLLPATVVLFGASLLVAATGYQGYMDLCVCVVNALTRGITALGVSILFGSVAVWLDRSEVPGWTVPRFLSAFQVVALLVSLFFFVQYVYFLLEVV